MKTCLYCDNRIKLDGLCVIHNHITQTYETCKDFSNPDIV